MDLHWNPSELLQSLELNNVPTNDYKQKFERQRDANKNLKAMITSIRTSAQDSLAMYNIEKAEKEYILKQQIALQKELTELKQNYECLENTSINRIHLQDQIYQELKKEKVEEYIELGKDYLSLWSMLTCYHNFEITKPVNKIISKTEKFIKKHEPEYKKVKIVKTNGKTGSNSYDYDTDSQISTMSLKSSIKRASDKSRDLQSKKRKTDTWDLCSNSTVLSPETVDSFDVIDNLDNETNDSSYSTNVSISSVAACDETSFDLMHFSKKCFCTKKTTSDEKSVQTNSEEYAKLVSVGTNTETEVDDQVPLQSLPFLLDDDLLSDIVYADNSATSPLNDDLVLEQALEYINTNKIVNNTIKDIKNTMDACTNTEVKYPEVHKLPLLEEPSIKDSPKIGKPRNFIYKIHKSKTFLFVGKTIATQTITESSAVAVVAKASPEYKEVGTITELYVEVKETCLMVDHATSTDKVIIEKATKHASTDSTVMSDASTITIHSSTTRGTSTTSIVMKNIGIQYPEVNSDSIDNILSEMKFVMPLCITPIPDINVDKFTTIKSRTIPESKIICKSFGTLTEINNVCRKVDYVITKDESRRIKKEVLSPAVSMGNLNVEQCPENRSFMVLGQTLFEIFLERLQMTRSHFMNEEISQQNWNEMKEKVMDEFLALTNEKDFPHIVDYDSLNVDKSKEIRRLQFLVSEEIVATQIEDTVIVSSSIEGKTKINNHSQLTNRNLQFLIADKIVDSIEHFEICISPELPNESFQEFSEVIEELPHVLTEIITPQVSQDICLESQNVSKDSQELLQKVSVELPQPQEFYNDLSVVGVEAFEKCSHVLIEKLPEGSTHEMSKKLLEAKSDIIEDISESNKKRINDEFSVESAKTLVQELSQSMPMIISAEKPQNLVQVLQDESLNEDLPPISIGESVQVSIQIKENIVHNEIAQKNEFNKIIEPIVSSSNEKISSQSTQPTFKLPLTPKTSPITNSKQRKREKKSLQKMLDNIKSLVNFPEIIEPIEDLPDVIWSCLFPKQVTCEMYCESPCSPVNILEDFDFDYETIKVPSENSKEIIKAAVSEKDEDMEVECILENLVKVYSDKETPQSPPPFIQKKINPLHEPKKIPLEQEFCKTKLQSSTNSISEAVLKFNPQVRSQFFLNKKEPNTIGKCNEKRLCKIRKSLKLYLEAPWTNEILDECLMIVSDYIEMEELLTEAIWETVDDQKEYFDVNADFTTPAPALPQYLQKIILLINKLAGVNLNLPKSLLDDLEEKVFKLDNSKMELNQLTNITYYYSALMDLFFDGDCSMIFHYIVKSFYYYGYKAVPMTHVLIKAFPSVLPKKSLILKKYLRDVDWDSISLLEVSKMELDYEQLDSLELTVMFMLTHFQQYNIKKHPSYEIRDHELFKYLPKYYGFSLNFMTPQKLLEFLMKRLRNNQLQNLSFSFILLARRMNVQFALHTMLKRQLIPLLIEYYDIFLVSNGFEEEIKLMIETISVILKPHSDEKDKSFVEIFSLIINILSRCANHSIQESCIKALLRLQRLNNNPKDIYKIIKQWNPSQEISQSLQLMIKTFVHRKNCNFFKN